MKFEALIEKIAPNYRIVTQELGDNFGYVVAMVGDQLEARLDYKKYLATKFSYSLRIVNKTSPIEKYRIVEFEYPGDYFFYTSLFKENYSKGKLIDNMYKKVGKIESVDSFLDLCYEKIFSDYVFTFLFP